MKNRYVLALGVFCCGVLQAEKTQSTNLVDSDGDGLPDFYERELGLDPYDRSDGQVDSDGDLLSLGEEYKHGSKDNSMDSDGDSLTDYQEIVILGTNPADRDDPVVIPSFVVANEVKSYVYNNLDRPSRISLGFKLNGFKASAINDASRFITKGERQYNKSAVKTSEIGEYLSLDSNAPLPQRMTQTGNFLNGELVEPNANGVIFGTDAADEIILNSPTLSETDGMSVNALGGDDVITVNAGRAGFIRGDVGTLSGGNDSITLASGATANQVIGDNLPVEAVAYGNDTITIAGNVIDGVFGDTGLSTAVGGNDTILIQSGADVRGIIAENGGANALLGDGNSGLGGDDHITVENGATIVGDLKGDGTIGFNSGGNDTIIIGGVVVGVVGGDVVFNSGANDHIEILPTGIVGFVKGDAADVDGGDDNIIISGRATLIQGDDTFQDGGNDTITVTKEGIVEIRDPNSEVEGTVAGDASHRDGGEDIISIYGTVQKGVVGDGVRRNGGNDRITIFEGAYVGSQVAGDGTNTENDIPGEFGGDDVIRILKGSHVVGPVAGDSGITEAGGNDRIFVGGYVETSVIGDVISNGRGGNDIIGIGQSAVIDLNVIGDKAVGNGGSDIIDVSGTIAGSIEGDNIVNGNGGPDFIFVRKRNDGAISVGGSIFGDFALDGNGGNDRIVVQGIVNGDVFGDRVGQQSGEDMIQVSGQVNGQIIADDLSSTSSRADDTLLALAQNSFRVEFVEANSAAELPSDRELYVILGLINGKVHLRIFDKGRNRLIDMEESRLVEGDALNRIKTMISATPFPDANNLTLDEKKDFVADVIEVTSFDLLLLRDTIDILPAGVVNGNILANNENGGKDNIKIRGLVNASVFGEGGDTIIVTNTGRVTGQIHTAGESSDTLRISGNVGDGVVVAGGDNVVVFASAVIENQFNSSQGAGADTVDFRGTLNGNLLAGGGDSISINSSLITGNIDSSAAGGDTIVVSGTLNGNLFAGNLDQVTINASGGVNSVNLNDDGSTTLLVSGSVGNGIIMGGGDIVTINNGSQVTGNLDARAAGADQLAVSGTLTGSVFGSTGDSISINEGGTISGSINTRGNGGTATIIISGTVNTTGLATSIVTKGGNLTVEATGVVNGNIDTRDNDAVDFVRIRGTVNGNVLVGPEDTLIQE